MYVNFQNRCNFCKYTRPRSKSFYCRSLSRKDIQILVGFGCPSPDKKVVFSAKLLRKLVHLDEGDVSTSLLVVFVPSMS